MELQTYLRSDAPPSCTDAALTLSEHRRDCTWLDVLPPACEVLRDYQRAQLRRLAADLRAGFWRIIVQLATGGGKTHEIAGVVLSAMQAGHSVLILATRTRLVRQLHQRLSAFEVPHGVIAASLPGLTNRNAIVQVASVDTLYRRSLVDGRLPLPSADVVIFDEAHLALGDSRVRLLEQYPHAWLIGFTATPAKVSGRPLGEQFTRLIDGPPVRSLIAAGVLVRPRIFNAPVVEADELAKVAKDKATGDYAVGELAAVMTRPKLTGDVVQNWLRLAAGKRTLVFSVDKAHGAQLVQDFLRAGVPAEQITDADDEFAREAAIGRLERGETLALVNCFFLSYGVDIPSVECISLARPTRSVVLYLQAVGRGMRPAPGKDSLTVLDHGRVVENLGLPTDDHVWSLQAGSNVNRSTADLHGRRTVEEKPRTCRDCGYCWLVSEDGESCGECGWKPEPRERAVGISDADLIEIGAATVRLSAHSPFVQEFYSEALGWYIRRWPDRWSQAPKKGRWWAWLQARERMQLAESDRMPAKFWHLNPATPNDATAGWLKSRIIRYARGIAKQKAQAA